MKKSAIFLSLSGLISLLIRPPLVLAQPTSGCGSEEINTAIGCIPVGNQTRFLEFIISWALGIAGGLFIIFAGYAAILIITASGDPKKAQAGREMLTSAIAGLVLLILGVFFLNAIGIGIFGLNQISL